MQAKTEMQLIALAQSGDNSAFDQLMQPYRSKLGRFIALRFSSGNMDAEDILQEVMTHAWTGLPGFRAECPLSAWLYRIATNTAQSSITKTSNRIFHKACPIDTTDENDMVIRNPDSSTPDLHLEAKQTILARDQKMSDMPPELADALRKSSQDDMSYEDIAKSQGVPVGTVRSRIFRAREAANLPTSVHPRRS